MFSPMKKLFPRILLLLASLLALALTTGCAEFANGLAQTANGMQAQQNTNSYGDGSYEHTARNTSAPGIK